MKNIASCEGTGHAR